MAKKSAKSKGYRKTVQKQPFLTKKEIIELVAVVVAIVLVVVLFNIFYDDGYLRPEEVRANDLVSYVNRQVTGRYVKLGVVNELDGFTLDSMADKNANARVSHTYLPEGENEDHIESINVAGNFNNASTLANDQTTVYALDSYDFSEVQDTVIQGHDAYVYSLCYDYYSSGSKIEAEDGTTVEPETTGAGGETEHESNVFAQAINCYVDMGDYSICLYINRSGEDASIYIPDEQLADYAAGYASTFTIIEPEKK